jgi:histidyl-tRNA synthetase
MAAKFVGVKGMNDLLPQNSYKWLWLEQTLASWLSQYGYQNIRTPILESTQLFKRAVGEVTDIVEKEMYSFVDSLNGDELTLRPEGTAGVVRSVIENNLLYNAAQKLWYIGPMFRHERPQKGRYRQFHQLGVEALGHKNGALVDCEIITMLDHLWQILGLTGLELQINCLGNKHERFAHREALIKYFEAYIDILDDDAKRRLYTNPLRILDTKTPALQEIVSNAPKLSDYLSQDSLDYHDAWKSGLDLLQIKYTENHRLVRGLDYYNLSVFEWVSSDLGSQSTVCGGGRYDPLITELGGKDNFGVGFAIGIERLLLSLEAQDKIPAATSPDIFVAYDGSDESTKAAILLANKLRRSGYNVLLNLNGGNFSAQFKRAANCGANVTLVIGESEVKDSTVVVKSMSLANQETIMQAQLVDYINDIFKG